MNKPGFYKGRHYSTYVEEVRELKRGEQWGQAEQLLFKLIEATEAEARGVPMGIVAPWYYENLAIIYRKQKNAPAEVAILERYFGQSHGHNPKLQERLEKARLYKQVR
jgi:hypothetical protein